MMSDDAPVSSSSTVSSGDLITSLDHNDVILGRGAGPSQFIGNLRFRSRVEERQEEYLSLKAHKHPTKARISRDLVDQTHALGGRFLKPVRSDSPEEVWYEVADSVAVEKCKQALRDHRRKEGPSDVNDKGDNGEEGVRQDEGNELLGRDVGSIGRDVGSVGLMSSPVAVSVPGGASYDGSSPFQGNLRPVVPSMLMSDEDVSASNDISEFMLSLLLSDTPRITEEQVEMERAMQTDEERAEALSDLFGKHCEVNIHRSKRARQDLDQTSIAFLVDQMRLEIKRIPQECKRALLEAQTKCCAYEFSNDRLEQFLRCEGMNVKVRLDI
jgi:hypothetical protein